MDRKEALDVLALEMARWRTLSWQELKDRVGSAEPETLEVRGPSGTTYQLEIEAFWDDKSDDVIRVLGCVDDGGVRAFFPLTECFLLSPDGVFIDED